MQRVFRQILTKNLLRLYDKKVPEAFYSFRLLVTDHFGVKLNDLENFYKFSQRCFTKRSLGILDKKLKRRIKHEPIQYIFGEWHFAELNLLVKKPVFIPRPETPQIVDICEELLKKNFQTEQKINFLEPCIGTGAISILLIKRLGDFLQGKGIDINPKCVKIANKNKEKNQTPDQISQIKFLCRDFNEFCTQNTEKYSFIISNPPYVSFEDYENLEKQIVQYESKIAFVSENEGQAFTTNQLDFAEKHLEKPNGFQLLEQCPKTIDLLVQGITNKSIDTKIRVHEIYQDIYGEKRFISLVV